MQQLALRDSYYNILAPQVAGNIWKPFNIGIRQSIPSLQGIYPDYASRHYVGELETLVVDIFAQRWAIFLNTTDFYLVAAV
jgi:hypothetical protein